MDKICQRCGKHFEGCSYDKFCYDCYRKVDLERTQEAIRSGDESSIYSDTNSSDYVICPWCGDAVEFQQDWDSCPEHYEEGFHESTCENCGKKFELDVECSWSCETRKLEDNE